MPTTPWLALAAVQPEREYLVQLTYLPLAGFRKLPAFFRHVQAIRGQLQHAEGAVGYSMRARILRLHFWTLSAWQDRSALNAFLRAGPHREAMSALREHMGPTRFIEWRARGSELPPRWADAMGRFQA